MPDIAQLCRQMAQEPKILSFSEIAKAAADGALIGQKVNNPLIGAVLGVSLQAGHRAVAMTEELLAQLQDTKPKMKN